MTKLLLWIVPLAMVLTFGCTCEHPKDKAQTKQEQIEKEKEKGKANLPPDASKPYKPDYSGITVRRVLSKTLKPSSSKKAAAKGSKVTVSYDGWIYDPKQGGNKGFKFAGSDGKPFSFTLGTGEVIKGWDQGMMGMKEGEKRQFIIPAELAYGQTGADNIPPGSHVLLEVELLTVKN